MKVTNLKIRFLKYGLKIKKIEHKLNYLRSLESNQKFILIMNKILGRNKIFFIEFIKHRLTLPIFYNFVARSGGKKFLLFPSSLVRTDR